MAIQNIVSQYTKARVEINFVRGEERCKYCPMLQTYSRPYCQRTGELIVDTMGRGMWCPLIFKEDVSNEASE